MKLVTHLRAVPSLLTLLMMALLSAVPHQTWAADRPGDKDPSEVSISSAFAGSFASLNAEFAAGMTCCRNDKWNDNDDKWGKRKDDWGKSKNVKYDSKSKKNDKKDDPKKSKYYSHDWGSKHKDNWGKDKSSDKYKGSWWDRDDWWKRDDWSNHKNWWDKDKWGDKDKGKNKGGHYNGKPWWTKKKNDGKDHHDHHGDKKPCGHDHHNGGNSSCPAGTELLAKYEWYGYNYKFEKGSSTSVTINGDEEEGSWTSTRPLAALVLKGSTDTETLFYAGETSGEFSNENLRTSSGQTPDISNIQFCKCVASETTAPSITITETGGVIKVRVTDATGIGSLSIASNNLTPSADNDFEPGDDDVTFTFTVTNPGLNADLSVEAIDICGNKKEKDYSKTGNVCYADAGAPVVSIAFVGPDKFVVTITDDTGIESIDFDVTNATADEDNDFNEGDKNVTLTYYIDNPAEDASISITATDLCGKSATDEESKEGDVCYADAGAPEVTVAFVEPNKFVITITDDTGIETVDVVATNATADPSNTFTPGATSVTLTYYIDNPGADASVDVTATDLCGKVQTGSESKAGNPCLVDQAPPVVSYQFIAPDTVQVTITDDTGIVSIQDTTFTPGASESNGVLVLEDFTPGAKKAVLKYWLKDLTVRYTVIKVKASDACGLQSCPTDSSTPGLVVNGGPGRPTVGSVTDPSGIQVMQFFALVNSEVTLNTWTPGATAASFEVSAIDWSQGGTFGLMVADHCNALVYDPELGMDIAEYDHSGSFVKGSGSVAGSEVPKQFGINQNYPNPFNPTTSISFDLPETATVRLAVYDVLGREVMVLVDGELAAGTHEVQFEAGYLPSGTYLYRLQTPEKSFVKQMVLMK